jgi:steroid delta-isomerase-like uncharacterized protein
MSNIAEVDLKENVSRLVDEMMAALNSHDVERLVSLFTTDYEGIDVNQALPQRGRGEARMSLENYFAAFPDLRMVEHETVISSDRAAVCWKARGTHSGSIMHIPPTGKEVEVRGATLLYIDGTQINRAVSIWDVAAMLREIGLLPEL